MKYLFLSLLLAGCASDPKGPVVWKEVCTYDNATPQPTCRQIPNYGRPPR